MMVCRGFHQAPDTVRAWDIDDYLFALESLGEVPNVDAAFFGVFCRSPKPETTSFSDPESRKAWLENMERREQ